MATTQTIGFIGLGVMGGPMCANLTRKSGHPVHVFDTSKEALGKLVEAGATAHSSIASLAQATDIAFLSLPSIDQVEAVCAELRSAGGKLRLIVDMSTSDVTRTRALAESLASDGIAYIDAPVARTAEAAVKGTLLITVGSSVALFESVRPLLECMGSDVLHCGDVGAGQMVKILNNMMVFMTVNALSEIITIGRRAGLDGQVLFDLLSKGSADSFVLRNHGMKSLAADTFPEKVFPLVYAIKDASLALNLAKQGDFKPHIAQYTYDLMCEAREAGFGQNYHPAIVQIVDGRASGKGEKSA
ncbi:NAD(P)-dependent oxidoreductase [Pandoraea fibrosis]|uniref:2-hydroxy-3-oxopropionate reductase n=1 Tax=Pandoraea fibrosis TaxID=1891094 RepID=A0A5E4W4N3_9BURK|nr:NAD(P)-dependent oxidoreductase [Pandoraea fibrosis]QHE90402.1 NAD-binding protein [Pandoraea fibrosis]QHF11234.1 NAD-binding protein [Pandoraea fibrosis]VVE19907.1 2-hydroxy-3-oxopropionate reductase [Pandoraea fibrosis]